MAREWFPANYELALLEDERLSYLASKIVYLTDLAIDEQFAHYRFWLPIDAFIRPEIISTFLRSLLSYASHTRDTKNYDLCIFLKNNTKDETQEVMLRNLKVVMAGYRYNLYSYNVIIDLTNLK